jgi:predicted class III extradiol MEMO1 family dioxygenase
VGFDGVSVNLQSAYETPLGVVPVDQEMGKRILNSGPHIRWIRKAHAREHSLEIQLPFLQTVLQNFQIVPILMGQQDYSTCSGGGPVITILLAARKLRADRAIVLSYANSGDITGDHRSVVGYVSAALIGGK